MPLWALGDLSKGLESKSGAGGWGHLPPCPRDQLLPALSGVSLEVQLGARALGTQLFPRAPPPPPAHRPLPASESQAERAL